MEYSHLTDIKSLKGVGKVRAEALYRLGIYTVGDLLYHFPRAYEYRGNVKSLSNAYDGEVASFVLTVATDVHNAKIRQGMVISKLRAFDDSASAEITFFNQPYLKDNLQIGSEYRFYGKITKKGNKCILSSPAVEPVCEGRILPSFVSVYPLSSGITQKFINNLIKESLDLIGDSIPEPLPENVRIENALCGIRRALLGIHMPESFQELEIAKRRLIFEEFYTFSLNMGRAPKRTGNAKAMVKRDTSTFERLLPFTLTGAQKRTIKEIAADLSSGRPMRRLVSGDVGSGKTAVAAAAAYIAVNNGAQCAVMAPTEILAVQHMKELSALFEQLGITSALLTGSVKGAARKKLLEDLKSGKVNILIGTHALIGQTVDFKNLGLVICDEQHRFGASQRESLLLKGGEDCHQLTMSATPIPRTLAMFLYGDIDMSRLDELPAGRQKVDTFVVNEDYRQRLFAFIEKQKEQGHQTYVICPSVEEAENGELTQEELSLYDIDKDLLSLTSQNKPKAVISHEKLLSEKMPGVKTAYLHGQLKAAQKEAVMNSFAKGEIDALVSTTVVEVGVNVPNATLMIIENAERFGLSQLHQLRGRVGRGSEKSYCILVTDAKGESPAKKRLEMLKNTNDGFKIAEYDLSERGPGDFLKRVDGEIRQHGEMRFRLANLCEDKALFDAACEAAKTFLYSSQS